VTIPRSITISGHIRKTKIKGAEVVAVFKFAGFRSVDGVRQDIFFAWMTCTECEASQVLSAFHYDADRGEWLLRTWDTDKSIWWTSETGPVIWSDTSASDVLSFDCVHGFVETGRDHVFGMRCREVEETETGKRKSTDITLRYTFRGASSKL